ncbi:RING finger 44-like [Paramuricea clavata]|uniref:RING finger 44-like n=1 Tax=Paramuricea clavata TaxID=317549 RepID=A0A6S7KP37_PARCT|nr:RING finger 44-like [Paramuricea clavata]
MASSSSGADFLGNCSQCSKINMKLVHCPALAGRGRHYANLPGLSVHPQVLSRPPNQCCPTTHQPVYPSFPVRLNSVCNCSRCRITNVDRRLAMTPHMAVNSCWVNPVEVHNTNLNTNFIPNPLQSQPCLPPRHVGMTPIAPMDGLPINGMSALYHHHHHFHHYHYHHPTQSRNNLHPYALPVLHPRLRRQAGRMSRHNEENPVTPSFIPVLTSEAGVTWERRLETEQLENVVSLVVDEKPKGISKCVLENLVTYRVTSKDRHIGESRCVICLMDFEPKQQVRILPCLHEYHSKCIDKWLKSNRSCPICRKEIKIS